MSKVLILNELQTYTSSCDYIYFPVEIGTQNWTNRNMCGIGPNTTLVTNATDWKNGTLLGPVAAYKDYDSNNAALGMLYNYEAIEDLSSLLPTNWTIPTNNEILILHGYYGYPTGSTDVYGPSTLFKGQSLGRVDADGLMGSFPYYFSSTAYSTGENMFMNITSTNWETSYNNTSMHLFKTWGTAARFIVN